ncbi:MAG: nuclear transport factor 2 family protein [Clostridiales Family XIII bacterium]|jgi:hypothetical protein|nr:nuclear transport factor 2 family protein [Clostridiales Family XIII bacterium]
MFGKLTAEQAITLWEDRRGLKNLMGKYVNCLLLNRDSDIPELFWSKNERDVCLGLNEGWYRGFDAVRGYYLGMRDYNAAVADALQKRFPDRLGALSPEEVFGVGSFRVNPLLCPVLEVAGDRETAKGLWYSQGSHARVTEAGPAAYWTWGYCAVDFVRENGAWRVWHLLRTDDIDVPCGQSWGKPVRAYPPLPEFESLARRAPPEPTERADLRRRYAPDREFAPPPRIPEPYASFSETFSYGEPCDV